MYDRRRALRLGAGCRWPPANCDSGIVDEDVDPPELLGDAVNEAIEVCLLSQISRHCDRTSASRLDGCSSLMDRARKARIPHLLGPRRHSNRSALASKRESNRPTQTPARPGDKRDAICESRLVCHSCMMTTMLQNSNVS